MKLLRYLTLADRAGGFPPDSIMEGMLKVFGSHTLVYKEVDRILKLTPEEARAEIVASVPETDYERRFIEELLKGLDITDTIRVRHVN